MSLNETIIPIPGKYERELMNGEITGIVYVEAVPIRGRPLRLDPEFVDCHRCNDGEFKGGFQYYATLRGNGSLLVYGSLYAFSCNNQDCDASIVLVETEEMRRFRRGLIKAAPVLPIAVALQERDLS